MMTVEIIHKSMVLGGIKLVNPGSAVGLATNCPTGPVLKLLIITETRALCELEAIGHIPGNHIKEPQLLENNPTINAKDMYIYS